MTLLSPPQLPARFGIMRFGAFRFGYLGAGAGSRDCAQWTKADPVTTTWTAVDPCVNTGA